jgi:hypothetical protein
MFGSAPIPAGSCCDGNISQVIGEALRRYYRPCHDEFAALLHQRNWPAATWMRAWPAWPRPWGNRNWM